MSWVLIWGMNMSKKTLITEAESEEAANHGGAENNPALAADLHELAAQVERGKDMIDRSRAEIGRVIEKFKSYGQATEPVPACC